MALALAAFPTFDTTDTSNLAPRWRKYVQRYENRATALNITNADCKLALLLDYAGEAVYDDFQTLVVSGPEADNPRDIYARSFEALNELYAPKIQVEYKRFNFREATQLHDENLDQFVTRLKKLAAPCDFTNKDAEIKSQIIQKCKSSKLGTKALADITITLDQLVKDGKAMERAISYAKTIEKKEVNAIQRVMTSDVVRPEDEAATPEEAVVEDAVPTTQHTTLQPSVTSVEDPTDTKEDDPSVLPTMPSVTNVELLDSTLISAEAAHPHRVWKTPTEDVAAAIAVEIAVEDDASYTTWSMETNSRLKRRCHSKLQPRANNAKTYTL